MKLKKLALKEPVLENALKKLEEATKALKEDYTQENSRKQGEAHYTAFGFIWGYFRAGGITENKREELIAELFEIQGITPW